MKILEEKRKYKEKRESPLRHFFLFFFPYLFSFQFTDHLSKSESAKFHGIHQANQPILFYSIHQTLLNLPSRKC